MTPTVKHNVLRPQYYDKFSCIMADCEDNCCSRDWRITVDKKTYNDYKNAKNPEFRKKAEKVIKRNRGDNVNDSNYAEFVFGEDRHCPFQTQEGLCEIHRDLGEGYLCNTCRTYPRITRRMIPEYIEMTTVMSCPEAVRVALFDNEPMEFTADTIEFQSDNPVIGISKQPAESKTKTQYIQYGWEMRAAAITIMQKRSCSVAHRVIIIAMMLDAVVEAHENGNAQDIPEILNFYSEGEYGEQFVAEFDSFKQDERIRMQMSVLLYVLFHSLEDTQYKKIYRLRERFKAYNESIRSNSGDLKIFDWESGENTNALKFYFFTEHHIQTYWKDFCDNWEHVLENYFVNFIFAELFPLTYHNQGVEPYGHSIILAEQYALLRILLCVNYDEKEGFSERYITQTISEAATMNQHSRAPLEIVDKYREAGISSPAHLFYLLM